MQSKYLITVTVLMVILVGSYYLLMMYNNSATEVTPEPASVTDDSSYVGLTVSQAKAQAVRNGVLFREVEIDGVPQPTTRDFQARRISAVTENGVVVSYTIEMPTTEAGQTLPPLPEADVETEAIFIADDRIIGMTVAEAEAYAVQNGVDFRTGSVDGEAMPVTMDFVIGRITAEVENDIVVDFTVELE